MKDTVTSITHWFKEAVPEPTHKNRSVQLGVHLEEIVEMLECLYIPGYEGVLQETTDALYSLSNSLKAGHAQFSATSRVELLDSLCDQTVTGTGLAYMFGMDFPKALEEVNASNYSKFVEGRAVFDANGKIKKGSKYSQPDLKPFV